MLNDKLASVIHKGPENSAVYNMFTTVPFSTALTSRSYRMRKWQLH